VTLTGWIHHVLKTGSPDWTKPLKR
jgi:hypothetical protein